MVTYHNLLCQPIVTLASCHEFKHVCTPLLIGMKKKIKKKKINLSLSFCLVLVVSFSFGGWFWYLVLALLVFTLVSFFLCPVCAIHLCCFISSFLLFRSCSCSLGPFFVSLCLFLSGPLEHPPLIFFLVLHHLLFFLLLSYWFRGMPWVVVCFVRLLSFSWAAIYFPFHPLVHPFSVVLPIFSVILLFGTLYSVFVLLS